MTFLALTLRPGLMAGALAILCLTHPDKAPERRLRLIPNTSDSRIEDIMESSDGARLITHDRGFAPKLWDAKTLNVIATMGSEGSTIHHVYIAKKGDLALTVAYDGAYVWDARRARQIAAIHSGKAGDVVQGALSDDGKWCALGTSTGKVILAPTYATAQTKTIAAHEGEVTDLRFTADGSTLLTGGEDGLARTINVATAGLRTIFRGHMGPALWVQASPDGTHVLTTGKDGTAKLFDLKTGKLVFSKPHAVGETGLRKNTLMSALFVGKHGEGVLCADAGGTMHVFSRATGAEIRTLTGHKGAIREIRESRDGLRVATYGADEQLKIWDATTGKETPFTRGSSLPTAGDFSCDGSAFWIGSEDGSVNRHDIATGQIASQRFTQVRRMKNVHFTHDLLTMWMKFKNKSFGFGGGSDRNTLARTTGLNDMIEAEDDKGDAHFSRDGRIFWMTRTNGTTSVGSLATRKYLLSLKPGVLACALSGDGKRLVSVHASKKMIVWDLASGESIASVTFKDFTPEALTMNTNGDRFVLGNEKLGAAMCDAADALPKDNLELDHAHAESAAFSPDDTMLAAALADGVRVFEGREGKTLFTIKDDAVKAFGDQEVVFWSPNSKYVALATTARMMVFDVATKAKILDVAQQAPVPHDWKLTFSDDSTSVVTANANRIKVWNLATAKATDEFAVDGELTQATFLPGGRNVVTVDETVGVSFWKPDAKGYVRDGSLVWLENDQWLVMDSQGRYDAPDPAKVDSACYVLEWDGGLEPISVTQLKQQFYEPGLLAKILGQDKEARRAAPKLDDLRLFPTVSVQPNKAAKGLYDVKLGDRDQGGVGKVFVYVNDKLATTKDGVGFFQFDLSANQQYLLPESQLPKGHGNRISVVATNEAGDLSGSPVSLDVGVPEGLRTPMVKMYALLVGVGDYAGTGGDLASPPSDAKALASAITDAGARLLPNRVEVQALVTGSDAAHAPTKPNIVAWFAATAKKATSSDIVFVFFAGHGTNKIGDLKDYFFLTMESDPTDLNALAAKTGAISGDELRKALTAIPAAKQVVILDTCHSGAAAKSLISTTRSVSGDFQRAYEAIRDSSGTWMLAGSAADQLSYESSSVDHGMLTYSLLEAIDKVTAQGLREGSDGTYFLDVDRWLTYAANRVESLKNEIGISGLQRPELKRSARGASFDLGVVTEARKGAIGLKPPRPILIMGQFELDQEDPAGVEKAVAATLRESGSLKLWTDVQKHPGAYRVAGTYTLTGSTIAVKVFVQKFNADEARKTIETFNVEGVKENLADLAKAIRRGVEERVLKVEQAKE